MKVSWVLILAVAFLGGSVAPAAALPPIKHVFVIVLENKDYEQSFGATAPESPYLARDLPAQGQLLTQYYGTSHLSLGNYVSMVSGLAANPLTQADCMTGFSNVFPGILVPGGQVVGTGCVYPKEALTIADQLEAKGLTWKGYMEDMGNSATEPKTCRHPPIGQSDPTQSARIGDQYAVRHNPFVYFHSVIDEASCGTNVVPLDRLPADLASETTIPTLSFISPNLCNDGHDAPCVDGAPGGLKSIDTFLRKWVPMITRAPGFASSGMLVVTYDEGNSSHAEACCGEQTGPNTPAPGITGPGGGRTGTVVISPYVRPGSSNATPYNHYSLLRSIEDLYGLNHLGYAALPDLRAFGNEVYNGTPAGSAGGPLRIRLLGSSRIACPARGSRGFGHLIASTATNYGATRSLLRVRTGAPATLRLAAKTGRLRLRYGPRGVGRCRQYRFSLPFRRGTVSVSLRTSRRSELRGLGVGPRVRR